MKTNMRIAVFYNLAFGGAKRAVFEHVKGLKSKGHRVDLYTTDYETDIFDPAQFSDTTYKYPFTDETKSFFVFRRLVRDYHNFFSLKSIHKKIASDIDSRKYDIVLVHPDKYTQAPFLLRFLNTPSAYYCQEPLRIAYEYSLRFTKNVGFLKRMYEEITRFYRKYIDLENVRSAKLTIASCYHIRERMIEVYDVFPKVSYLGVDEKVFRPLKRKKLNQLLFIGSKTHPIDGYSLAEKALELIHADLRPKLKVVSWRKENGQRLSEKELVELYNESILTLCMSRFETFGLVPLESMACGTPVIATRVSGHRETIIDGKSGFLVDFEPEEIAKKIIAIKENKLLLRKLSKNARKECEYFWNWEKRIDELEGLLKQFA